MVSYKPLWKLLIDRGLKRSDLYGPAVGISRSTVARMAGGEYVALEVIEKICRALHCRIEDVVEVPQD